MVTGVSVVTKSGGNLDYVILSGEQMWLREEALNNIIKKKYLQYVRSRRE